MIKKYHLLKIKKKIKSPKINYLKPRNSAHPSLEYESNFSFGEALLRVFSFKKFYEEIKKKSIKMIFLFEII